jgi:UDP:flavonoid glycosyltransferase YjiC (YdhE family)
MGLGGRAPRTSPLSEEGRRRSCLKHLGLQDEGLASVHFKIAEAREEREQAFRVLHDAYVDRGLIDPSSCGLRMSVFSFLPATAILVGLQDGLVVSTMSLIEDSSHGLPMDDLYGPEVDGLRRQGRRVAEIGALAVKSGVRGQGLTVMMNSLLMRWALFHRRLDDLLITVHPKSADLYRTLYLFEPLGGERMYGKLKGAPAVLLRMDLRGWISRLRAAYDSVGATELERRSAVNLYRFLLFDPHPNLALPAPAGSTGVTAPPAWDPFDIADLVARGDSQAGIVLPKERPIFWARNRHAANNLPSPQRALTGGGLRIVGAAPAEPPVKAGARKKILFVGEAMTLGNVARPLALACALDPDLYEVSFACDPRFQGLYPDLPFPTRAIHSISSQQFLRALAAGSPIYDAETLRRYVREDLEVIEESSPDAVVGCFRLSLAISARLANLPYLGITNACWSPYRAESLPFVNPVLNMVGPQSLLTAVKPLALAYHSLPFNKVCRENGVPTVGFDVRRVFTEADHALYSDVPELFPTSNLPTNHHYLGPIEWSAGVEPPWWDRVPADKPEIYVTMGSSGRSDLLPKILDALSDLPVSLLVATAGRLDPGRLPSNVFAAKFLPGKRAAARARLVLCNGGPTALQALSVGAPVIGVAGNMNQTWNMEAIQKSGAGELLRAAELDAKTLRATVKKMLARSSYAQAAVALASTFSKYDPARRLEEVLGRALSHSSAVA